MILLVPPVSIADANFKMHSGHDPDSAIAKWLSLFYDEVFRRLDTPYEILYLPNKRGTMMTEAGLLDGQVNRVFKYQETHLNQLRVDEAILNVSVHGWVLNDSDVKLTNGWKSFNNTDLHVEYVRGVYLSEKNLIPIINPERLTTSTYAVDGLINLKFHLSDVFVHSNIGVYQYLIQDEYRDVVVSAGILTSEPLYPYVHISHSGFIDDMKKTIHDIKSEGLMFQYCLQAYGESNVDVCREMQAD
jgi:hypothetical protein